MTSQSLSSGGEGRVEEFGGSHGFHGELRSRGGGGAIEFKGGSLRKLTANEGWGVGNIS